MAGGRHRNTKGGPHKSQPQARRNENNRIYAHPLPIVFENILPKNKKTWITLGLSLNRVLDPHCQAYFDVSTRSVWVLDEDDRRILWSRGFWGKGDLSRSEPSWLKRKIGDRVKGKGLTSEELREKRRIERKQFKLDRARAIAAVAAEAEAIFETEGRVVVPALSGPEIPSGATWKPTRDLFAPQVDVVVQGAGDNGDEEEEEEEDMEHLQLTLQEAFFLSWGLGCLCVLDPETVCLSSSSSFSDVNGIQDEPMNLQSIWTTFQRCHLAPRLKLQWDNPFLVHYVAFHHYRSLGWVVKNGIKFCVDYLLYKRGPVFTHAECVFFFLVGVGADEAVDSL
ncbi:tRNA splicing endonuclease subunit sen2 [Paramarasmius palmivorus]|uniref:tRNA-splicing endonuclease subunit Sen2 n=1 Tax=Paramarasmius palmivorus TaxID=297713 RepID=A0AAW0E0J1_9AGAR